MVKCALFRFLLVFSVQNLLSVCVYEGGLADAQELATGCVAWSHQPLRFDVAGKQVLEENRPVQTWVGENRDVGSVTPLHVVSVNVFI